MEDLRQCAFCRWQGECLAAKANYLNGMMWREIPMNDDGIRQQLEMLKIEHRDLDAAIIALQVQALPDQLQIARLKRKKLSLKDHMRRLEDHLVPDILA
jgi:hypothetical protein